MLICLIISKINRPLLIDAREQVEETVKVDRAWEVEKRFQLIAALIVRTFDHWTVQPRDFRWSLLHDTGEETVALSASKIVQRIPRGATFSRLEGWSRVDKSSVVKRNAASVAGEKKQEKKTRLRPTGKRVEWKAGGRRTRVRQRRLNSANLWHAAKGTRTEIPCKYDSSPSPSSFLQATGVALFPLLVAKPSSEDGREKGEKRRLSRVDEWRECGEEAQGVAARAGPG